jgi:hypothetical protein
VSGPNEPVVGTIEPPPGTDLSGFAAACSADVATYDGFSVVTFKVMTPPDVPIPDLGQGLDVFSSWPNFPRGSNRELIVWRFVVPSDGGALPVGSSTKTSSHAAGDATEAWYEVTRSGWSDQGASRCGSQGGGGGSWNGATVVFLSACGG